MSNDMLIRKKALKIQERLGMRLGLLNGVARRPVVRNAEETMTALREMYKVGLKAFVLPRELFSRISSSTDLYKLYYGDLLRIKEEAQELNIELSITHPAMTSQFDDQLKLFCSIASTMDARIFILKPHFYSNMPLEQGKKLVVYKINEILTGLRVKTKIGIETTGRISEVGSLNDVIDIVKRTSDTEPVINWGNIHARGVGAMRTQEDFKKVIEVISRELGSGWLKNAFFIFSGCHYGPSGLINKIPLEKSDIRLDYLIKEIMSFGIKGTLILDDPAQERLILGIMDDLADMVR